MVERGRIVVIAAGFALWKDGRCIASARWADIRRVRADRTGDETLNAVRLGVDLADGTVMELEESFPGFDAFLDRASATLAGLLPVASWRSALPIAPRDSGIIVLFERPIPRQR